MKRIGSYFIGLALLAAGCADSSVDFRPDAMGSTDARIEGGVGDALSPSDSGNPPAVDALLQAATTQLLEDLADEVNGQQHTDARAFVRAAAAYLRGRAMVTGVRLHDDASDPRLLARLVNGVLLAVVVEHAESSGPPWPLPLAGGETEGLPVKNAALRKNMRLFENDALSTVYRLHEWLSKEAGYQPDTEYNLTLDFFDQMFDYGIVHIETHGEFFSKDAKYEGFTLEEDYFALQLSTIRDDATDLNYWQRRLFQDRKVILWQSARFVDSFETLQLVKDPSYGMTQAYVAGLSGSFQPYSMVFLDACYSATDTMPLVGVLIDKGAAGVLGWSEMVDTRHGNRASEYIYSRLLGRPFEDSFGTATSSLERKADDASDRPRVPLSLMACYEGLEDRRLVVDPGAPNARLIHVPGNYGTPDQLNVLLKPSIANVDVDDLDEEVCWIGGQFGPEPPSSKVAVTIGGTEVEIDEWDADELKVSCTADQHGPIQVTIDDHESNVVPLTRWTGTFTSKPGEGSGPRVEATIKIYFRGDLHPTRTRAETNPNMLTWGMSTQIELESNIVYAITGAFTDDQYDYKSFNGGGTIRAEPAGKAPMFNGQLQMMLFDAPTGVLVMWMDAEVSGERKDLGTAEPYEPFEDEYGFVITMTLTPDEYGQIPAGNLTVPASHGTLQLDYSFVLEHPYDDDTPG